MTKKLKRKPAEVLRDPEINGIPESEYNNPKSPKYIPSSQRPNEPSPIMVPGYLAYGGKDMVQPGYEYRGQDAEGIHYQAKKPNTQARTPKPNPPPPILGDQQPTAKAGKIPPTIMKELIAQKDNPISPTYGEEPQENMVEKKIVRPLSKEYFEKKYPIQMLAEPPKKKK